MKNITVTVRDDIYRQARVWAAQRDTSVSAVVAYLLDTLPGISRAARAFPGANQGSAKAKTREDLPEAKVRKATTPAAIGELQPNATEHGVSVFYPETSLVTSTIQTSSANSIPASGKNLRFFAREAVKRLLTKT